MCPECGCIDLEVKGIGLVDAENMSMATASCPNCQWNGSTRDTVGMATTERLWTIERLGETMLRVSTKHAAGPIVQLLEFSGLLPKILDEAPPPEKNDGKVWSDKDLKTHNELAQQMRDVVMQSIFESMLRSSFETAANANRVYAKAMGVQPHVLATEFVEDMPADNVFGGNVRPINKGRTKTRPKKKRQKASR